MKNDSEKNLVRESSKKIRADALLMAQNLAPSRTRAQSLIMSGVVYKGTQRINKASELLDPETELRIKGTDHPFVSRGGVKLQAALDYFQIDVTDKICLDVGASTGGFTDCLLKQGAKKVYALDVGYGQLHWSMQKDTRVEMFDRTNFRHFDINLLEDPIDIITMDVSFISIAKLIPKVVEISRLSDRNDPPGRPYAFMFIFLIKPQFEVGKEFVGKKGVVRDKKKQQEVVQKIEKLCEQEGFKITGTLPSPILGPEGNQEYLLVGKMARRPDLSFVALAK